MSSSASSRTCPSTKDRRVFITAVTVYLSWWAHLGLWLLPRHPAVLAATVATVHVPTLFSRVAPPLAYDAFLVGAFVGGYVAADVLAAALAFSHLVTSLAAATVVLRPANAVSTSRANDA